LQAVLADGMVPPVALAQLQSPMTRNWRFTTRFCRVLARVARHCGWAVARGVTVRFVDLPLTTGCNGTGAAPGRMRPGANGEPIEPPPPDSGASDDPAQTRTPLDPLDWLRVPPATAGAAKGWWNHMVEKRGDGRATSSPPSMKP